jgi:hypothetical protein
MKRTNILVGVLLICLSSFASDKFSSNDTSVAAKMSQMSTIEMRNPYKGLPEKDNLYPCIEILAKRLNISAGDLYALINFETGGRMNPQVVNKSKTSSAKGLLQFTDGSAKKLLDKNGKRMKSSAHLIKEYSTIKDQLEIPNENSKYGGPVFQYLNMLAPFKSTEDLYMAVMHPASRKTLTLPANISKQNAGIKTAKEFVSLARHKVSAAGISFD